MFGQDEQQRALNKFFEMEVRPILAQHCYECHGEKKQKGGLRVDDIIHLKAGGDNGPALVPGKPEESPLIEAVRYTKSDFQMPPKTRLPDAEVAVLEKWVKLGAPWPSAPNANAGVGAEVALEGGFTVEQRKFWCFQPLGDPKPPALERTWIRNDIDRFIAQKHVELGLDPAPEADAREFLRRATQDLHGLPPTPAQIEAFENDHSPEAHSRLIDELLASPHYGERWAQHWLDLTRYAESDGYNADEFRPAAWPYRDWVIDSLNRDMPYDQFVREQLAGDELALKKATEENVPFDKVEIPIATAYLRNPIYEWNQADVRSQWDIILTDITDTTGELFLGLSFGCARCHNHKFDPILQKDYFRLRAFFTPLQWRDDLTLASSAQKEEYTARMAEWEAATGEIRAKMAALVEPHIVKAEARALKRFNDELRGMVRKSPEEREPIERQLVNLCERQIKRERRIFQPLKALKNESDKAAYTALVAELKTCDNLKPKPLLEAFVATDVGPESPLTAFKTRKGEQTVAPGFLTLLEPGDAAVEPLKVSTGRRTALANWITRPDNQLSTRVIVNRVWQYHFGRGMVASSSDFGKLGEQPSHPELLDWLARRFVAEGWSLKKLHREIMLSATYRQTARRQPQDLERKLDPANRFLWRFNPRRLDAEQARDAMLTVSGELDSTPGGAPEDATNFRRSIYTIKKRNSQNELLRSLDAPAGFSSTSERQSTTTPTQALLLLNGDWTLARARKLASKAQTPDQLWQTVLGRPPGEQERESANAFLTKRLGSLDAAPRLKMESTTSAGVFREKTEHERLQDQTQVWEGDDFTLEAVFRLDSIDANAAVRTLASRWNGAKDNLEGYGWSIGVTGEKSRLKGRNLIVQLVGEDENSNIGYELAASNLRVELGRRYYVSVSISCSEHVVKFVLQDLETPNASPQIVVVPHALRGKFGFGVSGLVLGGLNKRAPQHQWDGVIEALQIYSGITAESGSYVDPAHWRSGALAQWNAQAGAGQFWAWSGDGKVTETADQSRQALGDLSHILLNSNEFFYLH